MVKKIATEVSGDVTPMTEPAEISVVEVTESAVDQTEVVDNTIPVEDAGSISEHQAEPESDKVPQPAEDLITLSAQADCYFKCHPEVDAIYIDKFGGMFPKNYPKVFVKDAILYQNPHFKQ